MLRQEETLFEAALVGRGVIGEWETTFARWCGVKYAFGTASGTMALYFALKAVGVQVGDEVIVPALDWHAATAAVLHLGAVPVFADIEPNSPTISPHSVRERLTERTKAIVATHLFGYPCDMPALRRLADQSGVALVEDAAQALGASCDGRKVGAWGDVGCFSFGVGKLLSCGEGGMVVTDRDDLAERLLTLSAHPLRQQWEGVEVNPFALKAPLNPLAAAHLLGEWEQGEERLAERQRAFERLFRILGETRVLRPLPQRDGCRIGFYRFVALAPSKKGRERTMTALWAAYLPVSELSGAQVLPPKVVEALRKGQLGWHPFPDRLVEKASLPCPKARSFFERALTLDWRIGLEEKAADRLREVLNALREGSLFPPSD